MTILSLKLNGEDVEVEFKYYKGYPGSSREPPEPPELEINHVYFEGHDVIAILIEESIESLEDQIIAAKEDQNDGL
jgi:hypothetical protein